MSVNPTPLIPACGNDRSIEDILAEIRAYAAVAVPAERTDWSRDGASFTPSSAGATTDPAGRYNPEPRGFAASGESFAASTAMDTSPSRPVMRAEAIDLPSVLRHAAPANRAPAASVHPFPRPLRKLTEALRAVQPAPAIATDGTHATAPPKPAAPIPTAGMPTEIRPAQARPTDAKPVEARPSTNPSNGGETPRQMTSFLDTRFKALSPPAPRPAPTEETASVPADPQPVPTFADLDAALGGNRAAIAKVLGREGAAEILRPMLKQWLLENMPRIVEQVLTLERPENTLKTAHKERR